MTGKKSSSKVQFGFRSEEERKKISHSLDILFAKALLSHPEPMSYEVWCFLHEILGGDV